MGNMKVLGIEAGIGSMLVSARKAGFQVVGNVDSRNQFHSGTFQKNFPDAFLEKRKTHDVKDVDLIVSQPKCSSFSSLSWANASVRKDMSKSKSTFPIVVESIRYYKPKFFLIDNLPKSLLGSPLSWWAEQLKDYTVNVEYISNYNYGNVQLKRNRVFIFGWRKDLPEFDFIPGEMPNDKTIKDIIDNIDENLPNHDIYPDSMKAPNMSPFTIAQARVFFENCPQCYNPEYYYDEGGVLQYVPYDKRYIYRERYYLYKRIGTKKTRWDEPGQTITSSTNLYHPIRNDPLTCRERAMIMGFPDDFEFVFNSDSQRFGRTMGCQTGQAVPLQFTYFMCSQIYAYLQEKPFEWTNKLGSRFLSLDLVEKSKKEYCYKFGKLSCINCVCRHDCEVE